MNIGQLTEQQKGMIVRSVARSAAALTLMDGAMALANGEITAETYAELMKKCVNWAVCADALDVETLKTFSEKVSNECKELCPPPAGVQDGYAAQSGKVESALNSLMGAGDSTEITDEQKKKMN